MLNNLRIGQRLLLLIALAITGLVIVAWLGISKIGAVYEITNFANVNIVPALVDLNRADEHFLRLRVRMERHVLSTDPAAIAKTEAALRESQSHVEQALKDYEATLVDDRDRELFAQDKAAWAEYQKVFQSILEQSRNQQKENAGQMLEQESVAANAFIAALVEHIHYNVEMGKRAAAQARAEKANAIRWSIAIGALTLLVVTTIGMLIARSIVAPLRNAVDLSRAVADGDLTRSIVAEGGDEIADMMRSLKIMTENLNRLIRQARDSSDKVSEAATELATASGQVATSSQQQNDAASSMAAAVEEMTVSINHISDRARDAESISRESSRLADEGSDVIRSMVEEMQRIAAAVNTASDSIIQLGQQSEKISGVVQVIKEVAEQTNLLALNAAIEAARAGEQGRGFAVVADEVRKLAERTSQSTVEISAMIGKVHEGVQAATEGMQIGVELVQAGVDQAGQAGEAVTKMNHGAQQVLATINDISSALQEQSSASNEIAQNVERIAQMADENSAAVEETSHTAHHLESLAGELQSTVGRFKV